MLLSDAAHTCRLVGQLKEIFLSLDLAVEKVQRKAKGLWIRLVIMNGISRGQYLVRAMETRQGT